MSNIDPYTRKQLEKLMGSSVKRPVKSVQTLRREAHKTIREIYAIQIIAMKNDPDGSYGARLQYLHGKLDGINWVLGADRVEP